MRRSPILLLLALSLTACEPPDPKAELEMTGLEAYWTVERPRGETQYIAPAASFDVRFKGEKPRGSVQATATFRRVGEESQSWGSAWEQIATSANPLKPGEKRHVRLTSDARYFSEGPIDGMFGHEKFKDAKVEIYLRVGASPWVKFGELPVERALGRRDVRDLPDPGVVLPTPPPPSPIPSAAAPDRK